MENEAVSVKHVLSLTGVYCAFHMGVGFASGQEMMQFYSAYGIKGFVGLAVSMVMFCIFAYNIQSVSKREEKILEKPHDIVMFYMGVKAGRIFTYFLLVAICGSSILKISGAGAALEEYFGLPNWLGRGVVLAVLAITVILGLEKLIDIMGVLGPIIIVFSVTIAVVSIAKGIDSVSSGAKIAEAAEVTRGGANWLIAAVKYSTSVIVASLPIWTINGRMSNNLREAKITAVSGLIALTAACVTMICAQIMNIRILEGVQILNLVLAKAYVPLLAIFFSFIILIGIYGSSSTDTWYILEKFTKDKRDNKKIYSVIVIIYALLLFS